MNSNLHTEVHVCSMDNGHNVKCPRCWHWHGVTTNFGHEPGAVLPDNRDPDKEKLCDKCQYVIVTKFPNHPSIPFIKDALEKQKALFTKV